MIAPSGIYLHLPFCRRKCPYCDFVAFARLETLIPRYLSALHQEISLRAEATGHPPSRSIFLGGGTPSLLTPAQVETLLCQVRDAFPLQEGAEVTLETNPGTVDLPILGGYLKAGVTRISLGVESLNPKGLQVLGRDHTAKEAEDAFQQSRQAGFSSISVDLMFGWPGQQESDWQEDLHRVLAWGPDHLSLYNLTLEEGTPLWDAARRKALHLPSEGVQARMYSSARRIARAAGFRHYEISNFALPGWEAIHNHGYWQNLPYFGFGVGAHSYLPGSHPRRWWNERIPWKYIESLREGRLPVAGEEELTLEQQALEMLLTHLRTEDGLVLDEFSSRFGAEAGRALERGAEPLRRRGLLASLRRFPGRLRLTGSGMALGDMVISRLASSLPPPSEP